MILLNWGKDTVPPDWLGVPQQGAIDQNELDDVLLNWGQSVHEGAASPPTPLGMQDRWDDTRDSKRLTFARHAAFAALDKAKKPIALGLHSMPPTKGDEEVFDRYLDDTVLC